jgi:hypothetical protein
VGREYPVSGPLLFSPDQVWLPVDLRVRMEVSGAE